MLKHFALHICSLFIIEFYLFIIFVLAQIFWCQMPCWWYIKQFRDYVVQTLPYLTYLRWAQLHSTMPRMLIHTYFFSTWCSSHFECVIPNRMTILRTIDFPGASGQLTYRPGNNDRILPNSLAIYNLQVLNFVQVPWMCHRLSHIWFVAQLFLHTIFWAWSGGRGHNQWWLHQFRLFKTSDSTIIVLCNIFCNETSHLPRIATNTCSPLSHRNIQYKSIPFFSRTHYSLPFFFSFVFWMFIFTRSIIAISISRHR